MRSLTFTLDTQTGTDAMAPATVTITEEADGTLKFTITNIGDADTMIGDLRGLLFNLNDDSLLDTLTATGANVTKTDLDGNVTDREVSGDVTGAGTPYAYEAAVEFGTAGVSNDDIQTTSFTLSSSLRGLTLDDIALTGMTVRQTSVGEDGGDRTASDKLFGLVPYAVNASDDAVTTDEDHPAAGNLFANDIDLDAGDADSDGIADGLTVTGINGDETLVGQSIVLANGETVTINADGSYSVDPSALNWLAAGETVQDSFVYSVSDGHGGSDTASVTITVTGVNDAPDAVNDTGATLENASVSGNVLANDSDPDLHDVLSVTGVNGSADTVGQQVTLASGALITVNADGSYVYDPNGQFDDLLTGQSATDSFTYQISDGHGGTDTATVTIDIAGIGQAQPDWEDEDHFGTFLNKKGVAQAISNVVLYLQENDDITKVKIDNWDGQVKDLDDVDLGNFLDHYFAGSDLIAVSIKTGNNHNVDLGPGEGQLFLLDGDDDIDYTAGGPAPEPLTHADLLAKADVTFDYHAELFF